MIIQITDDFDLDRIAQSGQCFRWEKTADRTFRIVAGRSCLILSDEAMDGLTTEAYWFIIDVIYLECARDKLNNRTATCQTVL